MRVFITGANGFIGTHVIAHLLNAGHDVTALMRDPGAFAPRFPQVNIIKADMAKLLEADDWQAYLSNIDAVINCAGLLQASATMLDKIHHHAPSALFTAAQNTGINKVVQVSSSSIKTDTDFARSKHAGDNALQNLSLDWTILRPTLIYAHNSQGITTLLRGLSACPFAIPMLNNGEQKLKPIHIDDVVKTIEIALTSTQLSRQIIYPCGPETLTLSEITQGWRGWLGLKPTAIFPIPRFIVAIACRVGNLLEYGPLRTMTLRQIEHGDDDVPDDFAKAVNFTPQTFATALIREPSGTADLWQARLYFAQPLITLSLAIMWLASGIIGLTAEPGAVWPLLHITTLRPEVAQTLAFNAAMVNILLGMMLLTSNRPRLLFWLQTGVVLLYTLALTRLVPELWSDIFSPLLKNIPLLVLILLNRILQQQR